MVKTKVMDFFKVLKDPDINRAITFGFSFLKAFGQGLEKNRINEKVMGSSHHFFIICIRVFMLSGIYYY